MTPDPFHSTSGPPGKQPNPQRLEGRRARQAHGGAVRIAYLDHDPNFHEIIRTTLHATGKSWIVESYFSGTAAVEHIKLSPPDAVLMDLSLPDIPGIQCARYLGTSVLDLPVIILTSRQEPEWVLAAIMAGACAYVVKSGALDGVVAALESALGNQPFLCAHAQRVLIALLSRQAKQQAIGTLLTPREIEVVGCLLHGRSDKEVGCALGMETGTAHAHVMAIYRKLNVHSRAEICRKLLEHSGCGLGPGSSAIF